MPAPKPQEWFNSGQAAEYLGLSTRQLTRLVQSRRIAFYRPSGDLVRGPLQFHRDDLTAHMAECRVEAQAS
jgi:excisionase family DNA binding protein